MTDTKTSNHQNRVKPPFKLKEVWSITHYMKMQLSISVKVKNITMDQ